MEVLIIIALVMFPIFIGIGFGITRTTKERIERNRIQDLLDKGEKRIQVLLDERDRIFLDSFGKGRVWLAQLIADGRKALDDQLEVALHQKKHPAHKSAEVVKEIAREKRELQKQVKFLEYQLRSYEEYFPQLEEYRELILDERVPLSAGADNLEELEAADPTEKFLSREEWEKLPVSVRNQLALDRYLAIPKSDWEIGRLYERYLGYLRETNGWVVTYHGALRGFEDLGRDLICVKDKKVEIVQAKCWSKSKIIHEKHVFQLFGTTIHYRHTYPDVPVTPVLATTTSLSEIATEVAKTLDIRVDIIPLPPSYPMIKCNINPGTGERIYHLPFDQQYDRTQICRPGECYVETVKEAEELGFRRAWRYFGDEKEKSGGKPRTTKKSSGWRKSHR
jgi:hypothetical protein